MTTPSPLKTPAVLALDIWAAANGEIQPAIRVWLDVCRVHALTEAYGSEVIDAVFALWHKQRKGW